MFTVILFYKYVDISDPEGLAKSQRELCQKLSLKGRMIIASEGINGTLEGESKNIKAYIKQTITDKRFSDIQFKKSEGDGQAFPKLSIKVRLEIVATHLGKKDVNPNQTTGKYLSPEELHQWIQSGKQFVIVDMRNDYETEVGYFKDSILSGMHNFWELPQVLPKLKKFKNTTVLTVCTGGVRCEKASGFLVKHGFKDVYQLAGGIHSYIQKYPGENFLGSLYVFDGRLIMGFNLDDPNREIVGRCVKCDGRSENFINCEDGFCNRHFIVCQKCLGKKTKILCPMGCRDYSKEHPEAFRV